MLKNELYDAISRITVQSGRDGCVGVEHFPAALTSYGRKSLTYAGGGGTLKRDGKTQSGTIAHVQLPRCTSQMPPIVQDHTQR